MLFRLCKEWGWPYIHPDHLARDLTPAQVDDWIRYAAVQNFGGPADDYRAGLIAWAAIAGGRGTKAKPEDFVPRWSSEPPTPQEYKERAIAAYARAAPRR